MKLSDFDYSYPKELVAQRPAPERDSSRMMIVDRNRRICKHSTISELPNILKAGDLIVANDTEVIPARLFGKRQNGERIELLLVEPTSDGGGTWHCLLNRARKIRTGEKFFFGMQASATVKGRDGIYLSVEFKGDNLDLAVKYHGVPPLPPYIERLGFEAYTDEDRNRYQTVFAKHPGSAAAPTAGLHFSEPLIGRLEKAGVGTEYITLHVGIDTFAPVRADDPKEHRMHGERVEISKGSACEIARAKACNRRVVAIGTTTTRALESAVFVADERKDAKGSFSWKDGRIAWGKWTTELFIIPGFQFSVADCMLTNFHQPKSTLLMMVAAFAGREFILECYAEAIDKGYRLFSYGDCMLII